MKKTDFKARDTGRIIKTPEGYYAFVPATLPPKLDYSEKLVMALSRADSALGELSGLSRNLPNPYLLIAPYVRREAVLSSRIEGTQADLADLLMDEAAEEGSPSVDADVQEVRNYVVALEYGIQRLGKLPLSLRLVRELHEKLMTGVRGNAATPGEFRRSQNWIGPPGSTLQTAAYVPPPPAEMKQVLSEWESFLHSRGDIPDLIQCALMHEQFEAIHPFLDGNGRIGRLLITLFLIERGRLSQPLLYLSDYIEAHRDEYYRRLQRIRTHGEWLEWLYYFLEGVEQTAAAARQKAADIMDLRESLRVKVQDKPRHVALLDALFINPYVTVKSAAKALSVTHPTARTAIHNLVEQGILEEVTGKSWGRIFLARPILEVVRS